MRLVILAFNGNDQTPCIEGTDYTTTWFLSYETALGEWTARGVHVIVVGNPGLVGTTPTTPDLYTTNRQLEQGWRASTGRGTSTRRPRSSTEPVPT